MVPHMVRKKNPLNGDWMCYIPGHPGQTYFIFGDKKSSDFVKRVNSEIDAGIIRHNKNGKVVRDKI